MFRIVFYLVGIMVFWSVIKTVLGIVAKMFQGSSFQASSGSPNSANVPRPAPSGGQLQGELKKDPVCGTFISTSTALHKAFGGETYYFCSAHCRDQFKG